LRRLQIGQGESDHRRVWFDVEFIRETRSEFFGAVPAVAKTPHESRRRVERVQLLSVDVMDDDLVPDGLRSQPVRTSPRPAVHGIHAQHQEVLARLVAIVGAVEVARTIPEQVTPARDHS
jgi:hypothetical protein